MEEIIQLETIKPELETIKPELENIKPELETIKADYKGPETILIDETFCGDNSYGGEGTKKTQYKTIDKLDKGDIITPTGSNEERNIQDIPVESEQLLVQRNRPTEVRRTFWRNFKDFVNFVLCTGYGGKLIKVHVVRPPPMKYCGNRRQMPPLLQKKPLRGFKFIL